MGFRGFRGAYGFALCAALASSLPAGAQQPTWDYGGTLAFEYDDNAGNAGTEHDRRGSGLLHAETHAVHEQRFGSYTALQVRESVALEQWLGLDALTNIRYSARITVLHKPGRGFHTPVLGAWTGFGARSAVSDIRSGFDYRLGLSAALPLTTAIQARTEVATARREATHGRAFDLDSRSWSLNLDWRVGARAVAYGGVRVDEGDFVVTARGFGVVEPKDEHLYLEPRASAIDADPAFGADWWAFRVDGRTVIGTLGVNLPLSPSVAVDLQVRHAEAGMGSFTYVRNAASLALLFRW